MSGRELCIACGADERFAIGLAVTLFSALLNSKAHRVKVFVIDGGVSEATKANLARMLAKSEVDVSLSWIEPDCQRLTGLKVSRELSVATYFRVFLPHLLPQDVDKVIYLDCDLVIEGDLCELWEMEMAKYSMLAVQDFWFPNVSFLPGEIQAAFRTYSVNSSDLYFNAGVLVIDLKQWRDEKIQARVCEFFSIGCYRHDQDGLNAVLAKRWKALDPTWNVQQLFGATNVLGVATNPAAMVKGARILHFSHYVKPWHRRFRQEGAARFHHYLRKGNWFSRIGFIRWFFEVVAPQAIMLAGARVLRSARRMIRRSPA